MIWQAPAALIALALVAGPILVHLLVRRHADRVLFPAMRFVPAVAAAAVRLRRPSDMGLLLLRAAAVAAAALAAAQPVLLTSARQRTWASRVARAVILDTSPSVTGSLAQPLADAETRGAYTSRRFASADLRDAIARAGDWLETTAAGSREIAIVSDFQRGAVDAGDLARLPPDVGLRFARAGQPAAARAPLSAIDGWRDGRWTPSMALDASGTQVTWARGGARSQPHLTVLAATADAASAGNAARAARAFGIPLADPPRRVEIAFAGAAAKPDRRPSTPWIAAASIALADDPIVAAAGAPLAIGERDGVLTAKTTMSAASLFAPALVRAVLLAANPPVADPERETAAIDDATLASWRREPVTRPTAVPPDVSDGRWLWGAALALVIVEGIARRRRGGARSAEETHVRAA
jgi:hypothetical protein